MKSIPGLILALLLAALLVGRVEAAHMSGGGHTVVFAGGGAGMECVAWQRRKVPLGL